ncbi:MAG: chorismate-binding protein [Cytophagales bacterium]|nr:chorismate-binding protein [Cytophagales bacterium]
MILSHNTAKLSLSDLYNYLQQSGYYTACYRLPGTSHTHLIYSKKGEYLEGNIDIGTLKGYLIHPYSISKLHPCILIPYQNYLVIDENAEIHTFTQADALTFAKKKSEQNLSKTHKLPQNINSSDKYISYVTAAKDLIKNHALQKVVLATKESQVLPPNFDISLLFDTFCSLYPGAFISLAHIPDKGTWLTVSPELLVRIDHQRIFTTVALAGTKAQTTENEVSEVTWSQKEIEEQALVSRYIIDCLKKIRVREFTEYGPKTVQSGNLYHLKTWFEININEINFEDFGSVMLHLLHPTSAVCGMPKEAAQIFINTHEDFDREYYSGYLGPVNMPMSHVNIATETHLYVNIRCAKIQDGIVHYYAGAGITEDSQPHKEYEETQRKIEVLKKLINSPVL